MYYVQLDTSAAVAEQLLLRCSCFYPFCCFYSAVPDSTLLLLLLVTAGPWTVYRSCYYPAAVGLFLLLPSAAVCLLFLMFLLLCAFFLPCDESVYTTLPLPKKNTCMHTHLPSCCRWSAVPAATLLPPLVCYSCCYPPAAVGLLFLLLPSCHCWSVPDVPSATVLPPLVCS